MFRFALILAAFFVGAAGGCAVAAQSRLNAAEAKSCAASGGFESRAPFGTPICQHRYADGGKSCSGKSDCTGRCLSDAPDNAHEIPIGAAIAGKCEELKQTFGCFARVEDGKLAEHYFCEE
jgi:hypothetical protein